MSLRYLPEGTVLDDRYLIRSLIGEGGFGMTYAAVNQRIGNRVAIKEFYWRDHVVRDDASEEASGSPYIDPSTIPTETVSGENEVIGNTVTVLSDSSKRFTLRAVDPGDKDNYELLKEKFLQEARILRDFEDESAVVKILDYFEANGTAYMVMEYLDGVTIRKWVKDNTVFEAEDIFRKMLPIMKSLSRIHKSGIIHRDISPDNIMLLPDGTLKLMDFGAARKYRDIEGGKFTTIARDNYAPAEQYDKNGRQGPWTDVYALCATMYFALTGKEPDSAVQRMFFDELKSPAELGISLEKPYEAIIMKGLSMMSDKRQTSMDELMAETEKALPVLTKTEEKKRKYLKIALPIAAAAAVGIGFFAYHQYDVTHKFRGIETAEFMLNAPEEMTAQEFAESQKLVDEALAEFAGEDNYEWEIDGDTIYVRVPLSCFDGLGEMDDVIRDTFTPLANIYDEPKTDGNNTKEPLTYTFGYEIKANWEDPTNSMGAGENQVRYENLTGMTTTVLYEGYISDEEGMSKGEWMNMVTDFKVRLDSLGIPYALGSLYGDDRAIVVALEQVEKLGKPLLQKMGESYGFYIGDLKRVVAVSVSGRYYDKEGYELIENPDGTVDLQITCVVYGDLPDEDETYYLTSTDYYYASGSLTGIESDGSHSFVTFLFDTFYFEGIDHLTADTRYIADLIGCMIYDTSLPTSYRESYLNMRDEEGILLRDFEPNDIYGINFAKDLNERIYPELVALKNELIAAGYETGVGAYGNEAGRLSTVFVLLNYKLDESNVIDAVDEVVSIIRTYRIEEIPGHMIFTLTDESNDFRARISSDDNTSGSSAQKKYAIYLTNSDETHKVLSDTLIANGVAAFESHFYKDTEDDYYYYLKEE